MTENQTPEQQERERQAAREQALTEFNQQLHNPANRVNATRLTTRQELNDAIRRASGRDVAEEAG